MVFERKYDWSTFKPNTMPVSAQTVGETLERLERQNGKVDKKSFLEASRPADSPTHALFEWDNEKAAEKYRLVQSGKYIADIKVTITRKETEKKTISVDVQQSDIYEGRGFINGGKSRTSGVVYNSAARVLHDADKRKNALKHAKEELFIFQRKYNTFEELSGVMAEIEKLKREESEKSIA